MRDFFAEPRHAAGFHTLIFYINVFNNPRRTQLSGKRSIFTP